MNRLYFLALVLICCIVKVRLNAQDLIPRSLLFDTSDRKELFKLSPSGEFVFYLKDLYNLNESLYYIETASPKKEYDILLDGMMLDYQLLDDFALIRVGLPGGVQSLQKWYYKDNKLESLSQLQFNRGKVYAVSSEMNSAMAVLVGNDYDPGLYRINLKDGSKELVRKGEGIGLYFFDETLSPIAAERPERNGGKSILYMKDGEWQTLRQYSITDNMQAGRGVNNVINVSADGKTVFFTDNHNNDKTILKSLDIASGEEKVELSDVRSDIMPVSTVSLEGRPLSIISQFGGPVRYVLDKIIEKDIEVLSEKIKDLHILDHTRDLSYWLVESMNGGANKYYLYDRGSKSIRYLFNDFPVLDNFPLNQKTNHVVRSFDKLELPINLYIREDLDKNNDGIPDQTLPTVLYVHGGPWIGWKNNNWLITRNLQLLANRGYAVIYSEFRGASTYGKEFVQKSNNQWGEGMLLDNKAIVDWAVDQGIAQPGYVGIFGWSYGGYAAMAGISMLPDLYACGLAMYGISNLSSFLTTDWADNDIWRKRVADINTPEGAKLAKAHSPINYVNQIKAPLFLTIGGRDRRIKTDQAENMAKAMQSAGKTVDYILYPYEGHDYSKPENWISFWGYAEEYLHDYLMGDYEPFKPRTNNPNYSWIIKRKDNIHDIAGVWIGPGDIQIRIEQENHEYIGKIEDTGKAGDALKVGATTFKLKHSGNGNFSGVYYRMFEVGEAVELDMTARLDDQQLTVYYSRPEQKGDPSPTMYKRLNKR